MTGFRGVAATVVALWLAPTPAQGQRPSLTVHDAVRMALGYHPRVALAEARVDESAASLGQARALRIPTLRTDASITRFDEPMIVAPLHDFDQARPPVFNSALVQSQWLLDYTLFDGGARRARIHEADASLGAAEAVETGEQMAVIEAVSTTYLSVLTTHGVDEAQRHQIAALEAERRRVGELFGQGRTARVEVLRADAALSQLRADHIATTARLQTAIRELARLIGVDAHELAPAGLAPLTLAGPDRLEPLPDLIQQAREASPTLRRVRREVAASAAAQQGARADWLPRLRLSGGFVTYGSTAGDFSAEWQGRFALSYAIFTGGARSGRVRQAAARGRAASERLRLAELEVAGDVDRILAAVQESQARVGALADAVEHLTEVTRIEQLALAAGAGVQTEYLRAEADLFRATAAWVEARHAHIAERVSLARALGELSPQWLATNLETPR